MSHYKQKRYTVIQLWELLEKRGLVDKHYRFKEWEHFSTSTTQSNGVTLSIIKDLLLLINNEKQYADRGLTQELRIPEDVATSIFHKIDNMF